MGCLPKCECKYCKQMRQAMMTHPSLYFDRFQEELNFQKEEIQKLKTKIEELSRRYYP